MKDSLELALDANETYVSEIGDISPATAETESPQIQSEQEIVAGFLFPYGVYERYIGFQSSAGAVALAYNRIREENLAPSVKWRFTWRYSNCSERLAAGMTFQLIKQEKVSVIFGPPCALAITVTGAIARYHNVPVLSWAAAHSGLDDRDRFPTVARLLPSVSRLSVAVHTLLAHFNWRIIALLYTELSDARKCQSFVGGILAGLQQAARDGALRGIYRVWDCPRVVVENVTDARGFLSRLPNFARVSVVCFDRQEDAMIFMEMVKEMKLTNPEYVYVMSEMFWDDSQLAKMAEDSDSYNGFLFVDSNIHTDDVNYEQENFPNEVLEQIEGHPFYAPRDKSITTAALYSPFLYDSVYLYALMLDKTLKKRGNITNGVQMVEDAQGVSFDGMSGPVSMGPNGMRHPAFTVRAIRSGGLQHVARVQVDHDHTAMGKVDVLMPERQLWQYNDGAAPKDTLECGFDGSKCTSDVSSVQMLIMTVLGVTAGIVIIAFSMANTIRRRLVSDEVAKMLWKVNNRDIVWLNDQSKRSRSLGSLRTMATITSNASDETQAAMAKGQKQLAHVFGTLCWVKLHTVCAVLSQAAEQAHLRALRNVSHDNVNIFVGLCLDGASPMSVWRYTAKGSLEDVIFNESVNIDWFFKFSLIKDMVNGLEYLHDSNVKTHGRLKSSNCVVDARWTVKLTDYGPHKLRPNIQDDPQKLLWTAPELLRMESPPIGGTPKGDVYAVGIVMQELALRDRPFAMDEVEIKDVIERVKEVPATGSRPFRPTVKLETSDPDAAQLVQLMQTCWNENPDQRPDCKQVKSSLRLVSKGKTMNLLDHVIKTMEKHAANLEKTVDERTRQLTDEMQKTDMILYKMLPKTVADRLKVGQVVEPEDYDCVTIFFSDVVGFTTIASASEPMQIVQLLNELYTIFDDTLDEYDVYKVETIGDGYMCASGVPERNGDRHASEVADMALSTNRALATFKIPHLPEKKLELRIGLHTGPVVAGVVGTAMPRYCLFGETVYVANRMESTGQASCIHISEETNRFLTKVIGGFKTKPRGEIVIKGKGVLFTHWLQGHTDSQSGRATAKSSITTQDTPPAKNKRPQRRLKKQLSKRASTKDTFSSQNAPAQGSDN